ncbi:MAG: DUF2478 domain-containing protein [Paracoccaceae bacterium]
MAPGKGDTDLLLFDFAEFLANSGLRTAGTVQINTESVCDGPCDMDVRVLPDGPDIRISQSLGQHAKGCRLDPAALEAAVQIVAARLPQGVDCLIVNKFGKHEADGRGMRDVIADAISRDIPVLVGLNPLTNKVLMRSSGANPPFFCPI